MDTLKRSLVFLRALAAGVAACLVLVACTVSGDVAVPVATAAPVATIAPVGTAVVVEEVAEPTATAGSIPGSDSTCTNDDQPAEVVADLPEPVRSTAVAIQFAVAACDIDMLSELASSEDFVASFGLGSFREVHAGDTEALRRLRVMLTLPPSQLGSDVTWPRASAIAWEDVTDEMLAELRQIGITDDELDVFDLFGGYIGHRTAISADGEWLYFVAGD